MMKRNLTLPLLAAALTLALLAVAVSCRDEQPSVLPLATASFSPGTFTVSYGEVGTPMWRQAPLVLDVTFAANRIAAIDVVSHGETLHGAGWFFRAYPAVPDQILVRQSTLDIDAFAGATLTRNAFVNAVNEAIALAGADPADLEPRISDAPLAGDLFVPGFHQITVPAGTFDIDGNPLTADTPADRVMLYSPDVDMTLRVSVGRNEFHLHNGGAFGLGQGAGGHDEGVSAGEISDDTWGGRWFGQVAVHQINDFQSTLNIDVQGPAARSAAAVVWGVERALEAAGGDPAALTPRQVPPVQVTRNPAWANPAAPFFVPGRYMVSAPGHVGDIVLTVTLDRSLVRHIEVESQNETESFWDMVWPEVRDEILRTQNLDEVDTVAGATASSRAIIEAVREALALADPGDL